MLHSAKMIHISWALQSNQHQIQPDNLSSRPLLPYRLLPVIVPSIRRWRIGLHASILNREHISEDTLLVHGDAEQLSSVTRTGAQLLARILHALVLAHHLEFVLAALLSLEQLPRAVDGPVSEVTVAGEAEGTGSERMVEEVADES